MTDKRVKRADWQELSLALQKRNREALEIYRPSDLQAPIHQSMAKERIVRGGKRAGKSIAVAMEFASLVTGRPIVLENGITLQPKYETATIDAPRQYWIIGWDTNHAATIHRLLFQRGMGGTLRTIQDDPPNGPWRTFNSASPDDQRRFKESKLAEPIIPQRLIKKETWAWESKKDYKFQSVQLTNGAHIYYWPSSARSPKQGEAVSGIWIDEDIQFAGHLKEWQDRLTDMKGWFMWSVWPHVANDALLKLLDRAAMEDGEEERQIETFQLIMSQNSYLPEEGKQEALSRMETEDEIARRDRGELLMDHLLMYDFFPSIHVLRSERHQNVDGPRLWLEALYASENRFPSSWTRYLSIDPSHTRTAVHGWVVPPPYEMDGIVLGNLAICEWELAARKYSADDLAEAVQGFVSGLNYEAFIMDQNAGRQTHAGRSRGQTTFHVYEQAFRKKKIISRLSHSGFIPGINVPSTRATAVRAGLKMQEHGLPQFLFIGNHTWATQKEFNSYRKKTMNQGGELLVLDEPAEPRKHDLMQSFEYFAAYIVPQFLAGTAYVDPSVYGGRASPALRKARELMARQKSRNPDYIHFGPGAAA